MHRLSRLSSLFLTIVAAAWVQSAKADGPSGQPGVGVFPGLGVTPAPNSNTLTGTGDKPSQPSTDGVRTEQVSQSTMEAVRDASLKQSAQYLNVDLDQLYKDRIGVAPARPGGETGGAAAGSQPPATPAVLQRDRMRRILKQILGAANNQSLLALIAQNSPEINKINAAIGILNTIISKESASIGQKTTAAEDAKFVADEKNHRAFSEVLMQEHKQMMAKDGLNKLATRHQIEMDLAIARHMEQMAILERERLELELGRAQ